MSDAARDNNRVPTLIGVSSVDGETPTRVKVNPATGGAIVEATISATGLATDSNQTDGSQKTQIVDSGGEAVTVTGGKLDVNATVDTSALATSAKQDTGNSSLSSIDGKTPALGQALAAASVPVVLTATQISTLTPQTDALTDTQLRATPVPVSGTFWQATQPVSGTVTANSTLAAETTKVIGTVNISAGQSIQLASGTNGIGKLTANSGVDIGDVDVTSLPALAAGTNAVGKLLPPDIDVTTHTNYARKYYTNAGAVTDGIVWSPASGKRWHVVTMYIQTSAAATITLEDDKAAGDDPVWKGEIAANSGVVLSFTEKYPMASGEDAADLLVTTSAGNIYITVVGYEV